jgi:three-Cys-motif partner protein
MAKRGDKLATRWPRWPHTKAKHDLLVRYLQAWFPILGRTAGRAIVLDAFAGPGRYDHGVDGSPVFVLETLLDHNDFKNWSTCEFVLVFNELDPERYESLAGVLAELREERQPWPTNVTLLPPRNQSFEDLGKDMLASLSGAKMRRPSHSSTPSATEDCPSSQSARCSASTSASSSSASTSTR